MEIHEDILWVLKMIGILIVGVLISKSAGIYNHSPKTATAYEPQTHYQTIILR